MFFLCTWKVGTFDVHPNIVRNRLFPNLMAVSRTRALLSLYIENYSVLRSSLSSYYQYINNKI